MYESHVIENQLPIISQMESWQA